MGFRESMPKSHCIAMFLNILPATGKFKYTNLDCLKELYLLVLTVRFPEF